MSEVPLYASAAANSIYIVLEYAAGLPPFSSSLLLSSLELSDTKV